MHTPIRITPHGTATAVAAASGGRALTSLDLVLCLIPISFFLSIVSLV